MAKILISLFIFWVIFIVLPNYSNIILLCTDPINYGGSSVNTLKLHHFFIQHKKKVKTIFINNNEKNTYNDNIYTIRPDCIEDFLNQIDFNPDLIITKSPLNFNLKRIFDCPIYFFISGIYTNYLNKYYYDLNGKLEHDEFINRIESERQSIKNLLDNYICKYPRIGIFTKSSIRNIILGTALILEGLPQIIIPEESRKVSLFKMTKNLQISFC